MKALLLVLCSILTISVLRSQDTKYSFREDYDVSLPAQLNLYSDDGNIEVLPSKNEDIEVYYIVHKDNKILRMSRQELEKEVILEVNATGNSLHISVKNRNHNWSFTDHVNVSFKIYTPAQTSCVLHTSDGNISLTGLQSDQQLNTSDGNLSLSDISGNINGKTSDGNIDIHTVNGLVDIQTSDGNITVKNIKGDIHAVTSDGNIGLSQITGDVSVKTSDGTINFSDLSGSFDAITSDGNISGNLIDIKKQLTLKTSSGNIHITIPGRLGLDLDISGKSLNIPLTNFSGKSNENMIRGKSNGGGVPVTLSASDGNVSVEYL